MLDRFLTATTQILWETIPTKRALLLPHCPTHSSVAKQDRHSFFLIVRRTRLLRNRYYFFLLSDVLVYGEKRDTTPPTFTFKRKCALVDVIEAQEEDREK